MVTARKANRTRIEEDPLGVCPIRTEIQAEDDEPPSRHKLANIRTAAFGDVAEKDWNDWHWQFRHRITDLEELARVIELSPREKQQLKLVVSRYPLSATPYYLSLIDPNNPDDPIRAQVVPSFAEVALAGMGSEDPLEEASHSPVPGLVHRYPDRVLMVLTDICPVLCRHCTRKREWRGGGWVRSREQVEAMLGYIRKTKTVRDVIISGGDPLTLATPRLEWVLAELRRIPHVEIIRIGSRYPVVAPQRIDDELCAMLSKYGPIWFNTHFNHPNEITPESTAACERLLRAGVPVNNQSVLLKGVNDTTSIQTKLCHGLLKSRVRPYYLFQCDDVRGTEHFHTPVEVGVRIIEGMRGHTSGLAIPTYVIDLPHGGGKVPLGPDYVLLHTSEELMLRNYQGHLFRFRNPKPKSRNGRHQQLPLEMDAAPGSSPLELGVTDEDRAVVRS